MAAKFCTQCGAQLIEGARFCSRCRCPVDTVPPPQQTVEMKGFCTSCGAQLIKGAAYCSKCRKPVESNATSPVQKPNIQQAANGVRTVKQALEHIMQAADTPGEMRISLNKAGGSSLFQVLGSIFKGGSGI